MISPSWPNTREVEIGLEAAQRLAGQDVELDRDQRAVRGIENAVRLGGADQPVADIAPRIVDVHHLRVLDVGIVDLAVARLDLRLDMIELEQVVAGERVHRADEIGEIVAHDEVDAVVLERFHRRRRALVGGALTVMRQLLPVRSGFCSEPDSANSFLMMLWVRMNQE